MDFLWSINVIGLRISDVSVWSDIWADVRFPQQQALASYFVALNYGRLSRIWASVAYVCGGCEGEEGRKWETGKKKSLERLVGDNEAARPALRGGMYK